MKLAGQESFVYLLFEHQSSPDTMMAYRMARYMLRIWERWLRAQKAPPKTLPVILPLLLSNDVQPWSVPRSLCELYAAPSQVLDAMGPHLLNVTLRIDDLSAQTSDALKARASLHAFGRLALLLLQRARVAADLVQEMTNWSALVTDLVQSRQGAEDFLLIVRYAHHVADFDPERLRELARGLGKQVEESVMTAAERLKAEGKELGRLEGKAQLLLRQLTLRFGTLPASVTERLSAATEDELERIAERVLSAETLDQLLV